MPTEITELCRQYSALLERLEETEQEESELYTRLAQCSQHCLEGLRQFRRSITTHGFPDRDTEIHFFKHIKPAIAGRHRYYKRIQLLHLGELKGCWPKEKERLSQELDVLAKLFRQHASMWQYFRSGATALDAAYFLREYNDWLLIPLATEYDETFCTCGDGQLAELIATDLQMQYIWRLLQAGEQAPETTVAKATQHRVIFTGTQSQFNDVVYLLKAGGIFNHGNVTLKDLKESCELAWNFAAKDFYHYGRQNAERKDPMRFVKQLVELFRRFLDDRND